jgi:ribosomal protein S9
MAAVTTHNVRAVRWEHGWELHIVDVGVTQSRTLEGAERMIRDYIESLTGRDASRDSVIIKVDLGGLEDEAAAVRDRVARAQRETQEAAAASRGVAQALRAAGLSVTDAAIVLGVSRGRISQLVRP